MVAFATEEELAAWTGQTIPSARAVLLLNVASGAIRAECGWSVSAEAASAVFAGWDRGSVFLPSLHVTGITSVTEDGVVLAPADFVWDVDGQVARVAVWPRAARVEVGFTHGWAPVPDAVKGVCLRLVDSLLASAGSGGLLRSHTQELGDASESRVFAVPSTGVAGLLSASDRADLDPFRLPFVA